MPTFDLAASAALVGVALFSGALFRPTQPKPKGIPIPEEYGEETNTPPSPSAVTPPSPFAVTTPADILEGVPVREPAFWRRTRAAHLLIAALLAGAVAVDVGAGAAVVVVGDEGGGGGGVARNAITHLLNGLVALYLLILSFIALSRSRGPVPGEDTIQSPSDKIEKAPWLDRIALHEHVVLHQCAVGIPASLLGAAVALIPSYGSGFGEGAGAGPSDDPAFLAHLILLAIATALIMGVPMGPELYLPLTQIYAEKVAGAVQDSDADEAPAAIESSTEPTTERTPLLPTSIALKKSSAEPTPNVAAVRTASLWSTLLFSYTTPVVWRGYNSLDESATFDIADLPILPADMRATYNYSTMRAELARRSRGAREGDRQGFWSRIGAFFKLPTPASLLQIPGLRLARAVLRANAGALALEAALAAGSAGLFYVPAWMTRGLVKWLEDQERAADALGALGMGAYDAVNATASNFVNATIEVMATHATGKPFTWTPYESFAPASFDAVSASSLFTAVAPAPFVQGFAVNATSAFNATAAIIGATMESASGIAPTVSASGIAPLEQTAGYASAWLTSILAYAPRTGDARWGWVWCAGLFASKAVTYMIVVHIDDGHSGSD
ncbi:uncharacterized protein SCHCODRAFT_02082004 [Schizophyllum commune H4-8]|uniref:uncharacterized protein n=1 Tax=Schizophyllum commune (strain H4-8 / FGSC 9210) TaxID=578458 RepID=UPI00215E0AAA|nr:uncharacterized protein SCHCODRAFT_02082004 [Schizophyllum commune H4-8]KAI5886822.1 hypothetical protein SCHCODRAFT_02082004 [Schizophyllum commune H4-8]